MSELERKIPIFDEAFDSLERGDLDRFIELSESQTHPECEFRSGIGSVVGGGAYKGPVGLRSWFGDLLESTRERYWRSRRFETQGERILFLADFELIGAASGAPITGETGAVFEFEEGLCVRIDSFMSHEEAREFAEASSSRSEARASADADA